MTTQESVILNFFEACEKYGVELAYLKYMDEQGVLVHNDDPELKGREAYMAVLKKKHRLAQLPFSHFEVKSLVADPEHEGEIISEYLEYSFSYATGKAFLNPGCSVFKVQDGKIVYRKELFDKGPYFHGEALD